MRKNDSSPSCACLRNFWHLVPLLWVTQTNLICKMGTKIKWIALQTEMQQTLPWKMHATSSDSSSPLSGIGFILTSPDIWAHLRLSVLPALWSLTPTMATLLLDLTKQPNTRYLPSPFACCLHSPNLTTLKIKLILVTAIFFFPVVCVLTPKVPVNSLLSELKPWDMAHSSLPQVQLMFPASCEASLPLPFAHHSHCKGILHSLLEIQFMGRVMALSITLFKNLQGSLLTAAVYKWHFSSLYFNKSLLRIKESGAPMTGRVRTGSYQLLSSPCLPRWPLWGLQGARVKPLSLELGRKFPVGFNAISLTH